MDGRREHCRIRNPCRIRFRYDKSMTRSSPDREAAWTILSAVVPARIRRGLISAPARDRHPTGTSR